MRISGPLSCIPCCRESRNVLAGAPWGSLNALGQGSFTVWPFPVFCMQAPGLRPIWDDLNFLVLSLTLVFGAIRMALQVKILATKPDDLISTLGT